MVQQRGPARGWGVSDTMTWVATADELPPPGYTVVGWIGGTWRAVAYRRKDGLWYDAERLDSRYGPLPSEAPSHWLKITAPVAAPATEGK
jgi:hypothetical protein